MPPAKPTTKITPPKFALPSSKVKVPTPQPKPVEPKDPGPAPDVSNGKAFHAWCMRKQAWKAHITSIEREAKQDYQAKCLEASKLKRTDPKRSREVASAILNYVVDTFSYEGGMDALTDRVKNDLDAFLQEDAVEAILRGEG